MKSIPIYKPYLHGREKEYVNQCIDSTWISSKGSFIESFETQFAHYINAPFATTVTNGTVAIHLALMALDIKAGDEVIVPTFTYIASVNAIVQTGATPVFADSLAATWQIDPADVQRKITPRTKAVMAVHLYGLPCDMHTLVTLCKQHDLFLIEDCAEAFGSYYQKQHAGTFGDVATFSFFGNKTITTGEGGMVITKTKELSTRAYHLKNQGVSPTREYWHDTVAYNYRMTNICAAIGCAQLEQADTILEKKGHIASTYRQQLHGLPLQTHEANHPDMHHSYWMCSILLDDAHHRQPLRDYLKAAGIETRPFFYPVHTLPPYLAHAELPQVNYPVAESLSMRGLNLPSYPDLSEVQVKHICTCISQYFSNHPH